MIQDQSKHKTALFKPYVSALSDLHDLLRSGQLAGGRYTALFESSLERFLGKERVLAINAHSQAIKITLSALGVQPGDEVILSPMNCLSAVMPYVEAGVAIKWCDIEADRGTLSPESLLGSISSSTKAIVHNSFCGYPGFVGEIQEIAADYGILLIDDGFEGFGSEYDGRLMGTWGSDATIFSLSAVRLPNAIEGGVIVFKDESSYEKAVLLRDLGIDRSKFRDDLGEIDLACDVTMPGYSGVMSNVNSYIALDQMPHIPSLLERQRRNADCLSTFLDGIDGIRPVANQKINPNYWVYGLLSDNKASHLRMFRERGIGASGVHVDISRYSVFEKSPELPGVRKFAESFLALPCGWWIEDMAVYDF